MMSPPDPTAASRTSGSGQAPPPDEPPPPGGPSSDAPYFGPVSVPIHPTRDAAPLGDDAAPHYTSPWQTRLRHIVDTMRAVSTETDPQRMVSTYATRMRGMLGQTVTIAISRRDLAPPRVRMTRHSGWERAIDPWRERHLLPVFDSGLFSELIYGDDVRLENDLVVSEDDPAAPYVRGMRSMLAIPQYENGESINMVVFLSPNPGNFVPERVPDAVLTTNLFGRATKNLVLSRDLASAYEALDHELRAVQDIQLALLPQDCPAIPTLELATHYQTSTRAGGDYYDFFELPDGKYGLIVADVSGHGTPAAVLMAIVHAIAHVMPGSTMPPDRVLGFINEALVKRYTREGGSFVTAFYGVYDRATRTLDFAVAGHPVPLLREADGTVVDVEAPNAGPPLGIIAEAVYPSASITLRPGQTIAVYTDGITEAFSPDKKMYGEQRLRAVLARGGPDANAIVAAIIEDLGRFAGLTNRSDDRTLVVGVVR
jgi:sigma-B regulation protein RsbU (phosphoserine phosphatase)